MKQETIAVKKTPQINKLFREFYEEFFCEFFFVAVITIRINILLYGTTFKFLYKNI